MILSKIDQNQNNNDDFISTSNKIEGYEIQIYNFRHQFPTLPDQIEFSIEYNNVDIPFEIEKRTGKLFYLISEDTLEFDRNGEKYFYLNVTIANGQLKKYFIIEIKLSDDEKIIQLEGSAPQKLYFDAYNQQVGQVSISDFDFGYKSSNFEVAESDLFEIDSKTGYLFVRAEENLKEIHNYSKIDVAITGVIGQKYTQIKSEVFIFKSLEANLFDQKSFDFKLDFSFDCAESGLETEFILSEQYAILSEIKRPTRFRLINNELDKFCQLNEFNGVLGCFFSKSSLVNTQKKKFNLIAAAYNLDDEYLQFAEYAQVNDQS
jgi:hypothetical protein